MTNRTRDRWPHADVLVAYLRDFAKTQEASGKVRYGVTVDSIARDSIEVSGGACPPGTADVPGFVLDISDGGVGTVNATSEAASRRQQLHCAYVIMATGLATPNVPATIPGIELATGYEDLPADSTRFEGKSILVLGMGNAAFETANALSPHVNYVHTFGSRPKPPHSVFSWESRYVGSLRAINIPHLDAYLLKSLDGAGMRAGSFFALFKCGTNRTKRCALPLEGEDRQVVNIGAYVL